MAFTTNFAGDYEDVLQRYTTTGLQQAEAVANQPFEAYMGQRVAGFSPVEQAGRERAMQLAQQGIGLPQVTQATDIAAQVAGYQPGSITPQLLSQTDISSYMSPFTQNVTDIGLREMDRQRQIEQQSLAAQAARAGAFGGSRQGIVESELARNYGQRMADFIAQQQQAAFGSAQEAAQTDINRLNQAQTANEALRQTAAGVQIQGASALSQAANQLRSLGYGDADIMRALGGEERQLNQAELDFTLNEFMRGQAFPSQQLSARLSPLGMGANVAQAAPTLDEPSFLQQSLGYLGAGAQIANNLGLSGSDIGSGVRSGYNFLRGLL